MGNSGRAHELPSLQRLFMNWTEASDLRFTASHLPKAGHVTLCCAVNITDRSLVPCAWHRAGHSANRAQTHSCVLGVFSLTGNMDIETNCCFFFNVILYVNIKYWKCD